MANFDSDGPDLELPVFDLDADVDNVISEVNGLNRGAFVTFKDEQEVLVLLETLHLPDGARTVGEALVDELLLPLPATIEKFGFETTSQIRVFPGNRFSMRLIGGAVTFRCGGPPSHLLFARDVDAGGVCRFHRTPVKPQ